MRLVWTKAPQPYATISQQLQCSFEPSDSQAAIVVNGNNMVVAVWVWNQWDPRRETIEFSGISWSPKWMTREILHQLFSYAFVKCGCQMVVTRNSIHNTRLHRQLSRFGFDRFDVPRLFGREEDGVFWTLNDAQWRASDFYLDSCDEQR